MITLITYDITNPKRLRKTHDFLKDFGLNTQKSVFECDIDQEGLKIIRTSPFKVVLLQGNALKVQ